MPGGTLREELLTGAGWIPGRWRGKASCFPRGRISWSVLFSSLDLCRRLGQCQNPRTVLSSSEQNVASLSPSRASVFKSGKDHAKVRKIDELQPAGKERFAGGRKQGRHGDIGGRRGYPGSAETKPGEGSLLCCLIQGETTSLPLLQRPTVFSCSFSSRL